MVKLKNKHSKNRPENATRAGNPIAGKPGRLAPWRPWKFKEPGMEQEAKRKLVHMLSGMAFLAVLIFLGRMKLAGLLIVVFVGGLFIINLLIMGWRFPVTEWFIRNFERKNIRFPGYATAWYVAGILLAATLLAPEPEIAAVICALAFGDGMSALFGERGNIRLPYNRHKTMEGVLAFFIATSITSWFFVGWIALPFALLAALLESLPLGIDDNFTVPIFGALFFHLF